MSENTNEMIKPFEVELGKEEKETELINKTSNANFVLFDKGNHLGTVTYEGDDLPTRFAV